MKKVSTGKNCGFKGFKCSLSNQHAFRNNKREMDCGNFERIGSSGNANSKVLVAYSRLEHEDSLPPLACFGGSSADQSS